MFRTAGANMMRNAWSCRADTVVAVALPMCCVAVLAEAYFRTDIADADCPKDCLYAPTCQLIQPQHIRQLEQRGIVVIPKALPEEMIQQLRNELQQTFQSNAKHGNDENVRQDVISWLRPSEATGGGGGSDTDTVSTGMNHCIQLLRGVAICLETNHYTKSQHHLVPQQCQLAMYKGDGQSGYQRHVDRCKTSLVDLGLLEWLRLEDYRSRAVTAILYLNDPDWPTEHGGALRCWIPKHNNKNTEFHYPIDVQPQGGSLVIFNSNQVEHCVSPSSNDRFALTLWISGELTNNV